MRRITVVVLLVVSIFGPGSIFSLAQQSSETSRKLVLRIPPQYPHMAMNMNIRGTVKIEAVVAPNGTVKSTEIRGGHPLLAQAAQNAIRGWKWEPAAHETHEIIEVKFSPE